MQLVVRQHQPSICRLAPPPPAPRLALCAIIKLSVLTNSRSGRSRMAGESVAQHSEGCFCWLCFFFCFRIKLEIATKSAANPLNTLKVEERALGTRNSVECSSLAHGNEIGGASGRFIAKKQITLFKAACGRLIWWNWPRQSIEGSHF